MERRLAAVLVADVVGYSRMIRADEEGTLAALDVLRKDLIEPRVGEHHGRVVKLMGDGLLVEFPSIVDAMRCAVNIQTALAERNSGQADGRKFEFRIGVNLGDIVIDGDDIQGDGVNVASRLESIAEPGSVCVSDAVFEQVRDRIEIPFDDMGERSLKNIDRPVHVWRWSPGEEAARPGEDGASDSAAPEMPVVAVLPFANISSDQEIEFLADGLTEDIITLLARTPGFLVISRYSTSGFRTSRQGATDIRRVNRELGARYVVEGSIRPIGDRLRISVQLVDAERGNQIWSERFDCKINELATLQDEVSEGVVSALHPELNRAEVELAERYKPKDMDAWTLYRRGGTALFRYGWNKKGFNEGARLYREAIKLDPDFAHAHAALSLTLAIGHMLGYTETADEAATEAERAISLAGNDSEVLGFAGCAISDLGDVERGIDILEHAIELNPSNAQAWTALGGSLLSKGEFEEATEKLGRGIRISPRDPRLAVWGSLFALSLAAQGKIDEGIAEARAAGRRDQNLYNPKVVLAYLLLTAGRRSEAVSALSEARRIEPDLNERAISVIAGKHAVAKLAEIWSEAS